MLGTSPKFHSVARCITILPVHLQLLKVWSCTQQKQPLACGFLGWQMPISSYWGAKSSMAANHCYRCWSNDSDHLKHNVNINVKSNVKWCDHHYPTAAIPSPCHGKIPGSDHWKLSPGDQICGILIIQVLCGCHEWQEIADVHIISYFAENNTMFGTGFGQKPVKV